MYASRNFFTSACVAVMRRIPPPNSSPSFEVSAIFCPVKIEDIFVCGVFSLELYILLSMGRTMTRVSTGASLRMKQVHLKASLSSLYEVGSHASSLLSLNC